MDREEAGEARREEEGRETERRAESERGEREEGGRGTRGGPGRKGEGEGSPGSGREAFVPPQRHVAPKKKYPAYRLQNFKEPANFFKS